MAYMFGPTTDQTPNNRAPEVRRRDDCAASRAYIGLPESRIRARRHQAPRSETFETVGLVDENQHGDDTFS